MGRDTMQHEGVYVEEEHLGSGDSAEIDMELDTNYKPFITVVVETYDDTAEFYVKGSPDGEDYYLLETIDPDEDNGIYRETIHRNYALRFIKVESSTEDRHYAMIAAKG